MILLYKFYIVIVVTYTIPRQMKSCIARLQFSRGVRRVLRRAAAHGCNQYGVYVCVYVYARASRSSTTEIRREKRREPGGQSVTSGVPAVLAYHHEDRRDCTTKERRRAEE